MTPDPVDDPLATGQASPQPPASSALAAPRRPLPTAAADRAQMLNELGDCHTAMHRYRQAEQCYRQAARLKPRQPDAFLSLGVLALRQGDTDKARKTFLAALRSDPGNPDAYTGLAMIELQRGNQPAAFELYLKALEANPDNLMALLGLFEASVAMGHFGRIIEYLELYLETHPTDTSVLFCLASLYARDDKLLLARRTLRQLLDIEPEKDEAEQLLRRVETQLARSLMQGRSS